MTAPLPLDPATLEDLYQRAPCGYLATVLDGTILQANDTFLTWMDVDREELLGTNVRALLSPGSRIFLETNYLPVLHLQHEVRDVALDLRRGDGETVPVLISSNTVLDAAGQPEVVRSTIFNASSCHEHERQLHAARRRAEESERAIREVAVRFQRSMLPQVVEQAPGFVVTTRYRPAVEDLEVGGDWYDAFHIPGPDGDVLGLSVGDVVGRGIDAACAMGQVRSALRAIAISGIGPARTLDQLDRYAEQVPDAHAATVVCAELDVTRRTVRYACAGHLPPLLLRPDRPACYLWDGRSLPLAVTYTAGSRTEGEIQLEPGEGLLFFTDGLVERRDRGLDEGMEQLAHAVGEIRPGGAGDMLDRLMATMLDGEDGRDDVCLLHLLADRPSG